MEEEAEEYVDEKQKEEEELLRLGENLWQEANSYVSKMDEVDRPVLCCPGRMPLVAVGPDSLFGVREVGRMLETIAVDETLFPHNRRYVPKSWLEAGKVIKRIDKAFLAKQEVEEVLLNQFAMRGQTLEDCLKYLHDIGQVRRVLGSL